MIRRPDVLRQLDVRAIPEDDTVTNVPLPRPSNIDIETTPLLRQVPHAPTKPDNRDHQRARIIWTRSILVILIIVCSYTSLKYTAISDRTAISQAIFVFSAALNWVIHREVPT